MYIKKKLKLISIFYSIILLASCAKKSADDERMAFSTSLEEKFFESLDESLKLKNMIIENTFSYELQNDECSTEKHSFSDKQKSYALAHYCSSLRSSSINNHCMEKERQELFEDKCFEYSWDVSSDTELLKKRSTSFVLMIEAQLRRMKPNQIIIQYDMDEADISQIVEELQSNLSRCPLAAHAADCSNLDRSTIGKIDLVPGKQRDMLVTPLSIDGYQFRVLYTISKEKVTHLRIVLLSSKKKFLSKKYKTLVIPAIEAPLVMR